MMASLLRIITLVVVSVLVIKCEEFLPCPKKCVCEASDSSVTCILKTLRNIPAHLPFSVQTLNLERNRISKIVRNTFVRYPNLSHLNLNHNKIKTVEEGAFNGLSQLKSLYLCGNRLSLIPKGTFAGVSNVTRLDMNRNELVLLTDMGFAELYKLEYLDLLENGILFVTEQAFRGLDSLKHLLVSKWKMSDLPTDRFIHLRSLQTLEISHMKSEVLKQNVVSNLTRLQNLHIGHWKKLTNISPKAFRGLDSLVSLIIHHTNISVIPSAAIQQLRNLKELSLNNNPIEQVTSASLPGMTSLKELFLDHCNLTYIGTGAFKQLKSLQKLDLSYNLLKSLPRDTFPDKVTFQQVTLTDNPWNCDCQMTWLIAANTNGWRSVYCSTPEAIQGIDVLRHGKLARKRLLQNMKCSLPTAAISQGPTVKVEQGSELRLQCLAQGEPKPSISWIPPAGRTVDTGVTLKGGVLQISSVNTADKGRYTCVVTNAGGTVVVNTSVTVIGSSQQSSGPNPSRMPNQQDSELQSPGVDYTTLLVANLMGVMTFLGVVLLCCGIIFLLSRSKNGMSLIMLDTEMEYVPRGDSDDSGGRAKGSDEKRKIKTKIVPIATAGDKIKASKGGKKKKKKER
ncbi:leucine-rich repeat and immunoglobulin-like domain-containing nogo receptor-interacting protein 3 isoform X1 [Branchiostoma lanceolatum]|uniref:leucine-rich repeat and immunoglobulin-like domain-containing nogo receptor-interacting protein 3 isoform X1 n=1 Tax=Branchiostoma lanceolatum TaxID=7740 RepID=UPI003451CA6E